MEGNIHDFSATEILQLLASQRKTGRLLFEHGPERRSVWVVEGRIVSTRHDAPLDQDLLFRFMRRIRRLSEEQLRGIATLHAESKRDLEDLLVQGRYMDADDLGAILERQILDNLTDIIDWSEGRYSFDADGRWSQPVIVRLSIEASLIEAARRADERSRFRQLFQDGKQIVSVRDLPDPDVEIAEEESELFGIIDGQHTISEVVTAAPLSDYEASEALQRMIECGWIEFVGKREEAPRKLEDVTATPAPAPSKPTGPSRSPGRARSLLREWAVAAMCLGCIAGLWALSEALRPARHAATTAPVFVEPRLADIRFALELYHRENGHYPKQLHTLLAEGWLEPEQVAFSDHSLDYRVPSDRASYELMLR